MAETLTTQPGRPVTLTQRFLRGGSPLAVSEPISYTVTSADGLLVAYGVATQAAANPEEWSAVVTVPDTTEPGDYEVVWLARPTGGRELERTSSFRVEAPQDIADEAVTVYAGDLLSDTLVLDGPAENVTVDLIDPAGVLMESFTVPATVANADGQWIYRWEGPPTSRSVGHNGVLPYGIHWRFTQAGERQMVTHSAYVFDHRMISQIETLQRYLDKTDTLKANAGLRFTTVELAHFLLLGLQRLNSTVPSSNWTVSTLPTGMFYAWQRCAANEALNALYLAIDSTSFSFSGQGSQIESSAGPAVDAKMNEIGLWIDNVLPTMKREAKRKGNLGVLGISMGPSINYPNLNSATEAAALLARGSRFFPLL